MCHCRDETGVRTRSASERHQTLKASRHSHHSYSLCGWTSATTSSNMSSNIRVRGSNFPCFACALPAVSTTSIRRCSHQIKNSSLIWERCGSTLSHFGRMYGLNQGAGSRCCRVWRVSVEPSSNVQRACCTDDVWESRYFPDAGHQSKKIGGRFWKLSSITVWMFPARASRHVRVVDHGSKRCFSGDRDPRADFPNLTVLMSENGR